MTKTRYLLHTVGIGDGCDYTIGCNQRVEDLRATNEADAVTEAYVLLSERGESGVRDDGQPWDVRVKDASIVAYVCDLPLDEWRDLAAESVREADNRKKEAREIAEYERLRAKLGR